MMDTGLIEPYSTTIANTKVDTPRFSLSDFSSAIFDVSIEDEVEVLILHRDDVPLFDERLPILPEDLVLCEALGDERKSQEGCQ